MNKLVILVMFFVGCSSVDPVSTQITVNETPAIESSKAGEYTTTTKLRTKKDESCPYYPVFETDIEYTYYSDGLIKTVHYISDNIGIYFEYEEVGDGVKATVYKYREDVSNRIETSTIDDISTLPDLLFMDTISYTNSGYKDTTLIISTANEGQNIEDYFDKYIINSKGQVDSIYHHDFGGGKLSSYEWFEYGNVNNLLEYSFSMNSVTNISREKKYEYYSDNVLKKVYIGYMSTEELEMYLNDTSEFKYKLFHSYNRIGNMTSIRFCEFGSSDTLIQQEWVYGNDKYLLSHKNYNDDGTICESSAWEYDSENNLTYEKLTIKADGKYHSEATYEYETVEVTVKNEQRFKEIRAFNEMVFQSHHMYMLNGIYLLDKL